MLAFHETPTARRGHQIAIRTSASGTMVDERRRREVRA